MDITAKAFLEAGVEIEFRGKGTEEKGYIAGIQTLPENNGLGNNPVGKCVVEVDTEYFRPAEVDLLVGNAEKARQKLGWKPEYTLHDMVKEMVEGDLLLMGREKRVSDDRP